MASVNMEKEGLVKMLEFFKEKCMYMHLSSRCGTPFYFLCSIILVLSSEILLRRYPHPILGN